MRRYWPLCFVVALALYGCLGSTRVPADRSPSAAVGPLRPTTPSLKLPPTRLPAAWRPSRPARNWRYIVLHHTASSAGSVESIHRNHLKRKTNGEPWLGIGYHFVIGSGRGMVDGAVEPTFRWRGQLHGAHAGRDDYNQRGIGIALVGNFEKAPPSPAQMAAVTRLVAALRAEYRVPASRIVGHKDIKKTICPGKHFPLAALKQRTELSALSTFSSP